MNRNRHIEELFVAVADEKAPAELWTRIEARAVERRRGRATGLRRAAAVLAGALVYLGFALAAERALGQPHQPAAPERTAGHSAFEWSPETELLARIHEERGHEER